MVQVRVLGVALDPAQQHVILLKPVDALSDRVLPVWIGAQEATSILVAIEGVTPPRPLAHDLMIRLIDATDASIDRVEVTRIDDGTFYAEVTVTALTGSRVVDARPSDAIALASRAGAPIFVADDVLAEAGIPDTVSEAPEGAETPEAAEQRVAEFRDGARAYDFAETLARLHFVDTGQRAAVRVEASGAFVEAVSYG